MEFNDGNEWHYITNADAYERERTVYEYRALSGTTGQMVKDKLFDQQRALMQPRLDALVYYQKPFNKTTPEFQANQFCDVIGRLADNEMVMLDIEGDINVPDPADFTRRWLAVTEARLNTRSWVYVPSALKDSLNRNVTGSRIVKAPHYSAVPSWSFDIHQFGTTAYFPGGNGPGDGNRTDLTAQQLLERCRINPVAAAPGVKGAIADHYNNTPGLKDILGDPITPELTAPDQIGRFNHFRNGGSIYWTPQTGAFAVWGAIRAAWEASGWELGPLGYPLSDEFDGPYGRQSNFEHGFIDFVAGNARVFV